MSVDRPSFYIFGVKPPCLPSFVGGTERHRFVLRCLPILQYQIGCTDHIGASKRLEVEEVTKKIEMRLYSKISFSKIDKDGKMQNAIRVKMNK